MTDHIRKQALLAGLPYLRQVVTQKGKTFTVMAYNFLNPPQVQVVPGVRQSAIGWDTRDGDWVSWKGFEISPQDAALIADLKANQ